MVCDFTNEAKIMKPQRARSVTQQLWRGALLLKYGPSQSVLVTQTSCFYCIAPSTWDAYPFINSPLWLLTTFGGSEVDWFRFVFSPQCFLDCFINHIKTSRRCVRHCLKVLKEAPMCLYRLKSWNIWNCSHFLKSELSTPLIHTTFIAFLSVCDLSWQAREVL